MTDRTRVYVELLAALQVERKVAGSVHPRYSYLERLVNDAFTDDALLHELHRRVQETGGLWA
jgi:hypothetical protein